MNRAATHSSVIPATPTRGVIVRNPWARNLLTFLMVFGPGLMMLLLLYHVLGLAGLLGKV